MRKKKKLITVIAMSTATKRTTRLTTKRSNCYWLLDRASRKAKRLAQEIAALRER